MKIHKLKKIGDALVSSAEQDLMRNPDIESVNVQRDINQMKSEIRINIKIKEKK